VRRRFGCLRALHVAKLWGEMRRSGDLHELLQPCGCSTIIAIEEDNAEEKQTFCASLLQDDYNHSSDFSGTVILTL